MSRKMREREVGGKKRRWVCHLRHKGGQITGWRVLLRGFVQGDL
jgi:hypothetical protein